MTPIQIQFVDFWPHFDPTNNFFINLLQTKFDVEVSKKPDIVFYSVFGSKHKAYNCCKIFYTGENIRPDFTQCDFAFSFDHLHQKNHYRLPIYALYLDRFLNEPNRYNPEVLIKTENDIEQLMRSKNKFCNFIYSNSLGQKRINFFDKLSKYKTIDAPGRVRNNMGKVLKGTEADKLKFMSEYKFSIAFENASYPGYTTEKLIHPMVAGSLPIYWGNELVHLDFNPKSFINYFDFENEEALIEWIINVDRDDDLYRKYLLEPYYHNNKVNAYIDPENILSQFQKILEHVRKLKDEGALDKRRKFFKLF